jgi:hypothetical protein
LSEIEKVSLKKQKNEKPISDGISNEKTRKKRERSQPKEVEDLPFYQIQTLYSLKFREAMIAYLNDPQEKLQWKYLKDIFPHLHEQNIKNYYKKFMKEELDQINSYEEFKKKRRLLDQILDLHNSNLINLKENIYNGKVAITRTYMKYANLTFSEDTIFSKLPIYKTICHRIDSILKNDFLKIYVADSIEDINKCVDKNGNFINNYVRNIEKDYNNNADDGNNDVDDGNNYDYNNNNNNADDGNNYDYNNNNNNADDGNIYDYNNNNNNNNKTMVTDITLNKGSSNYNLKYNYVIFICFIYKCTCIFSLSRNI